MRTLLLIIFFISVALSHKLGIFSTYDRNFLYIEAYFANGSPCQECDIVITDEKENQIFKGKLDKNGIMQKELEINATQINIKIDARNGHMITKTLEIIKENQTQKKEITEINHNKTIDENMLRTVISQELDKKIAPLLSKLDKNDEISLQKILCGLGYIFGIFALLLFLKQKKNDKS